MSPAGPAPSLRLRPVEELDPVRADLGPEAFATGKDELARQIFDRVSTSEEFIDFLTLPAYEYLP
jgi:malate synthase